MRMRNKKNVLTVGLLAVIFFGGLTYLALNRENTPIGLTRGHNTVNPVSSDSSQNVPRETVDTESPSGPYITKGPNARDDNFFIPGRVESLASLADPTKQATVVWVSASWCEICHAMRPFVAKSANKYADKVALKEIDYDINPGIVRDNAVYGTPAFFVLDQSGAIVSRFSGATQVLFEQHLERASQS